MEKKNVKKKGKVDKATSKCGDKLCPIHGLKKLKTRGRILKGVVIRKFPKRTVIEFERMKKLSKYERYEKRKTRIHARVSDCMENLFNVGDLIEVSETRPISKMIHFVVSGILKVEESNLEENKK